MNDQSTLFVHLWVLATTMFCGMQASYSVGRDPDNSKWQQFSLLVIFLTVTIMGVWSCWVSGRSFEAMRIILSGHI